MRAPRATMLGALAAVALAGCGGQSAQQKLTNRCDAYGPKWAADYTAPYAASISSAQVAQLARSATQECIAAGGPGR